MPGGSRTLGAIVFNLVLPIILLAPTPSALGGQIRDHDITMAIEGRFVEDDLVSAQSVDVSTREGIVILSGKENNLLAKERAAAIARMIRGVRSVINNIEVERFRAISGQTLKKMVQSALLMDPVTESYDIDVRADDGLVALTGRVDSWQEKDLCTQVVKGVKGVRGVQNNLLVVYKTERPDGEIAPEVRRRLHWDIWVNDEHIEVQVRNGAVILSGKVGSALEISRAYRNAWVNGVQSVDTRGLEVHPRLRDAMRRTTKKEVVSAAAIRQAVLDAFLYDPRVFSFLPRVAVDHGTVTLSGTVSNLKAKQAAAADARNTLGVWRVKNFLKVRPEQPVSDENLAKRIEQAMVRDPVVDRYDLTVSVEDGEAYLYGTVNSRYEKNLAGGLASGIRGVEAVHNYLDVRWSGVVKSDRALREDIEDNLWWSPFVDSDQVTVRVSDGTATLTGTVDSYLERGAALDNAYSAGASRVINLLKVRQEPLGLAR